MTVPHRGIQQFSTKLAEIYSNIAKPVLDVMWAKACRADLRTDILASLYNYQLSRNVGAEGLVILTILVQTSAGLREWTK